MKSANWSVVSSCRACAASNEFRSASMSLTACIAAESGFSSASFMPGELRVRASPGATCPGSTGTAAWPPASASRSRSARAPRRAVSSGTVAELHLGQPGVVAVLAGRASPARRRAPGPSGPDLIQRAGRGRPRRARCSRASGGPRSQQLVQPAPAVQPRRASAVAGRRGRLPSGEHVLADPRRPPPARRTAVPAGRARRATAVPESAVAEARCVIGSTIVTSIGGIRPPVDRTAVDGTPCPAAGSGAGPPGRTRPRPRSGPGSASSP